MLIEVTGVNTWNKGAELMLASIRARFRGRPEIRLAVDQFFGSAEERGRYGLLLRYSADRVGRTKLALGLLPKAAHSVLGIVTEEQVDAVLDASGFAFGDQHPVKRSEDFATRVERWKQLAKTVILMPQALGPFHNPGHRAAFARIARAADLIFARDRLSAEHARGASDGERIREAPDFTALMCPPRTHARQQRALIVPNQRMLTQAPTPEQAEAYLPFLATIIAALATRGLQASVLIHGAQDRELVGSLSECVGRPLDCLDAEDPMDLKRELQDATVVVGSRFHALVSALSQGVPCLATSWSHKYEMLFEDYDCPEMILAVGSPTSVVEEALDRAVGAGRTSLIDRLAVAGQREVDRIEEMWRIVEGALAINRVRNERAPNLSPA